MAEYVCLVNRTSKTLLGTWNGREYKIAPGKNEFPRAQAEKFVTQHPKMGTRDPYTGYTEFLLGVVENGQDITPCEQDPSALTLDDIREKLKTGEYQIIKGNGTFQPQGMDRPSPIAVHIQDVGFEKP